jgi:2-polyprenyl-6-methoxyphenol hydroxylase-like FAD-dependent oxidoreductase
VSTPFDAIVVGARCGGAPTAMLLARKGWRVLLVDRATFPSDTLSTHLVHPPGVAALARWGVLDAVVARGTPAIERYSVDFGPFGLAGPLRPTDDGVATAYAPTRVVLDDLLVEAAAAAGVDVREGVAVEGLVVEDGAVVGVRTSGDGGHAVEERARVVIGADGRHSHVARWVGAEAHAEQPTFTATYYSYWSGVPVDRFEAYVRDRRSFAAFPTNEDLTLVVMGWPRSEFAANRHDVDGTFLRALDQAPELADRVRAGTREARFHGTGDAPGFYRRRYGPGWALVGDAAHHKDPCTAQGISDAFRDAESLAAALDDVWSGRAPFDDRLAAHQQEREAESLPMYEFTCQLAALEPPPPELAAFLEAASRSPEASTDFVSVVAGTVGIPEFLAPENVARVLEGAGA